MNQRIKKLWLKALRSGEYEQATRQLRKGDTFCCLGVLCNLHALEHPEIALTEKSKMSYLGEYCSLPSKVVKWAELKGWDPIIGGTRLSFMNDERKLSFKEIAMAIEVGL